MNLQPIGMSTIPPPSPRPARDLTISANHDSPHVAPPTLDAADAGTLSAPPVDHADHEWTDAANSQNQLWSGQPVENKRQTEISSVLGGEADAARDPKVSTHNCLVCDKQIKITKSGEFLTHGPRDSRCVGSGLLLASSAPQLN
ncbi:hypothetical protein ACOME3_008368 [Neoechinorhynchus agilis]